jgi:hypothetical protein
MEAGNMEDTTQPVYETPVILDYGTLAELTQANQLTDAEDGVSKTLNTDGSTTIR